jgi:hypothetical protein
MTSIPLPKRRIGFYKNKFESDAICFLKCRKEKKKQNKAKKSKKKIKLLLLLFFLASALFC